MQSARSRAQGGSRGWGGRWRAHEQLETNVELLRPGTDQFLIRDDNPLQGRMI